MKVNLKMMLLIVIFGTRITLFPQGEAPISILAKIFEPQLNEFNIKHPLENQWVMWFDYPPPGGVPSADYRATLHQVRVHVFVEPGIAHSANSAPLWHIC